MVVDFAIAFLSLVEPKSGKLVAGLSKSRSAARHDGCLVIRLPNAPNPRFWQGFG